MVRDNAYIITPLKILFYLGQWPPEDTSQGLRTFYTVYNIITAFYISVVFATSEWLDLIHLIIVGGDLNKITNNLTHAVSHGLGVIKHLNFLSKRNRIRKLIHEMRNDENMKYEEYLDFSPDRIIEKGYKKVTTSTFILGGFATTFIVVGGLAPVFAQLSNYSYYSNDTIDVVRPLPMSSWFPFDTNTFPNYYFAYSYQVIGLMGISWMIVSLDNLFVGIVVELTSQVKILKEALVTIKERSVARLKGNPRKTAAQNDFLYSDGYGEDDVHHTLFQREVMEELKHCILHHQKIVILSKEAESIFNINVFGQFLAGSIIICVSLFQCATRPISLDFAYMFAYLVTISFQLFLYCWFGNEFIVETNSLSDAVYNSDWINECEAYKRSLSIIMARSKKPVVLTAGGFIPISTQTYSNVLNAAYSYFAILKQIYNK